MKSSNVLFSLQSKHIEFTVTEKESHEKISTFKINKCIICICADVHVTDEYIALYFLFLITLFTEYVCNLTTYFFPVTLPEYIYFVWYNDNVKVTPQTSPKHDKVCFYDRPSWLIG